jgi:alkylhydroperoxidase family enzyme
VTEPLRVPLVPADQVSEETAALLSLTAQEGRDPPPTVAVLAHTPALLGPFLGWAAALALEGALSHRDHELLALRAAWNSRSAFEWGEHLGFARKAGITDAEIEAVAEGPTGKDWTAPERNLLRAADELYASAAISTDTLAALAVDYAPAVLVEIPFVYGQYTMLSMVANAIGAEPDPAWEPMPGWDQQEF